MKEITIFTPTYNRLYSMKRLYRSLINQTNKDFIWLIVDDGSTDKTEEYVREWINNNKIEEESLKLLGFPLFLTFSS